MTAPGPLAGVWVVDLTRVLAGPYCTMVLADLGARVTKVEAPGRGDDARAIGPFVDGESAYFASLNRGKESIALDLKQATDRAVFEAMLERADVLAENFRPGVLERLGYGIAALRDRYPRLVIASTSGFGQSGPYANRPAYDIVVQAMGGVMSLTGHPGSPPTRVGTSIGDVTAGLFTAIGIQSALLERGRTGKGMAIDVAMLDSQIAILENAIARFFATGEVPGPLGSRHPSIAPFEALATADGYLVVAAGNDDLFEKLCGVLACPELVNDDRFTSNDRRRVHADDLCAALEEALARESTAHWLAALEAGGIPCGPLNDVASLVRDPHVAARNMIIRTQGDGARALPVAGNPIKLSGYRDPEVRAAAPALDADRAKILAELGISSEPEGRDAPERADD